MVPRLKFAALPTPIQPLPRLSGVLEGPEIFIKRDDLTGLAFGGNKTRKLEYLMADAAHQNADLVITTGAVQSNHCRQTAAAAARIGLKSLLVLVGSPPARPTANLLLDELLGAELRWAGQEGRDHAVQEALQQCQDQGRNPYLIPYGGSNRLGAYAYLEALRELRAQWTLEKFPDWIVLASSSGGTQAGLAAGVQRWGLKTRVLGISVDQPQQVLVPRIAGLADQVLELMDPGGSVDREDVEVNADYCGNGYAVMGEQELEAIQLFAQYEGILLDPVYTGRAAAGLIDLIRRGNMQAGEQVLFWHTGGTPALFADRYQADLSGGSGF